VSLQDCTEKKKHQKVLDFKFFVGDVISGVGFRPFGPLHLALVQTFR